MSDFGGGYQSDRAAGGNGYGSSGYGGPGGGRPDGGGARQPNTAYAYDPRKGRVVQIGAPSLTGRGMMTTAAGYNLSNFRNGVGGIGPLSWSGGLHDRNNPFHQSYRNNLQANIRDWGAARQRSEFIDRGILETKAPFSRIMGTKAACRGDLPELEHYLGQPSAMRKTHHTGGIWGSMFNTKGDDVETTFESRDKLQAGGHMDKYGNLQGFGPMNPVGFLSSLTSAPVSRMMAKSVYDYTGDIPASVNVGQGVNMGMNAYGKRSQPDFFAEKTKSYMGDFPGSGFLSNVPTMAASAFTGAPVGLLGQTIQAADVAATLNNLGITGPRTAPVREKPDPDTPWWWPTETLA